MPHSHGRPEAAESALSAVLEEQLPVTAGGTVCALLSLEEELHGSDCPSWRPAETDTWRGRDWAAEGCRLVHASLLSWLSLMH